MKKDLHDVLGVLPDVTDEQIQAAFAQSAETFAREKKFYEAAKAKYQKARRLHESKAAAFEVLGDKNKRATYIQADRETEAKVAGPDAIVDEYIARPNYRIERDLIAAMEGRPDLKRKLIRGVSADVLINGSHKLPVALSTEVDIYFEIMIPAHVRKINSVPNEERGGGWGSNSGLGVEVTFLTRLLNIWPEESGRKLADFLLDSLEADTYLASTRFLTGLEARSPDKYEKVLGQVYLDNFMKSDNGATRPELTSFINNHPAVAMNAFERISPHIIAAYTGLRRAIAASIPPEVFARGMVGYYVERIANGSIQGPAASLVELIRHSPSVAPEVQASLTCPPNRKIPPSLSETLVEAIGGQKPGPQGDLFQP